MVIQKRILRVTQQIRRVIAKVGTRPGMSEAEIKEAFDAAKSEYVYAVGDVLVLRPAQMEGSHVIKWRIVNKKEYPLVDAAELALWQRECVRELARPPRKRPRPK